jgi:hypothetical protein
MNRIAGIYAGLAAISITLAGIWQLASLPGGSPAEFPLRYYQNIIGHLDGRSCPSYPVCSLYARQAVERHGLLLGSMLIIDRLIHEADDLEHAHWVLVEGEKRLYDPLSRNDFWIRHGVEQ